MRGNECLPGVEACSQRKDALPWCKTPNLINNIACASFIKFNLCPPLKTPKFHKVEFAHQCFQILRAQAQDISM